MKSPIQLAFVICVALVVVVITGACAVAAPAANEVSSDAPTEEASEASSDASTEESAETSAGAPAAEPAVACVDPDFSLLGIFGSTGGDPPFITITNSFVQMAPSDWSSNTDTTLSDIDQNMLVFYTGHGTPDWFEVSESADIQGIGNLRLGQCSEDNPGAIRYFVQSSCNTMAHGPQFCETTDEEYGCPGEWHWDLDNDTAVDADGVAYSDTDEHGSPFINTARSVFARWGPVLGDNVRMVCGASTELDPANAYKIWNEYNGFIDDNGNDVPGKYFADSILAGLAQVAVSVCLAEGGDDFALSPLVADSRAVTEANPFEKTHFHLQNSKPFVSPYEPERLFVNSSQITPGNFPESLPILFVDPAPKVQYISKAQSEDFEKFASSEDAYFENQGSLEVVEEQHVAAALGYIRENIFDEQGLPDNWFEFADGTNTSDGLIHASGTHMMLTTIPQDPAKWVDGAMRVTEKNSIITFKRRISLLKELENLGETEILEQVSENLNLLAEYYGQSEIQYSVENTFEKPLIDVLGWGGIVELQLDADESIIHARKTWRDIVGIKCMANLIPPEDAYQEALSFLDGGDETHKLDYWTWGYFEGSEHGFQEEMWLSYEFRFVPNDTNGYTATEFPPRIIRVSGQEEC